MFVPCSLVFSSRFFFGENVKYVNYQISGVNVLFEII